LVDIIGIPIIGAIALCFCATGGYKLISLVSEVKAKEAVYLFKVFEMVGG